MPRSVRGQLGTQSALGVVSYVQQALQRGGQHGNHGISVAEGSDACPRRNDGEAADGKGRRDGEGPVCRPRRSDFPCKHWAPPRGPTNGHPNHSSPPPPQEVVRGHNLVSLPTKSG